MDKKKKYMFFIGIDVSKDTLDFGVNYNQHLLYHKCILNTVLTIKEFVAEIRAIEGLSRRNVVFGMENTGIYSIHLIEVLEKLKFDYVVENPFHLKQSLGMVRGKSDKIDSQRIALYLYKSRDTLRLSEKRRLIIDQLAGLVTLRSRILSLQSMLTIPLKEDGGFINKALASENTRLCSRSVEAVKLDLKDIELSIKSIWKKDEILSRLMKCIMSVPSVGEVTAIQIIVTTNEFKNISDPKKFACYSGVAPFGRASGTALNVNARVSKLANRKMKALLHTCAVVASIHVPDIKEYFLRKTQNEGKHKMVVYNAIRFKLINRVFACVHADRLYSKTYQWKGNGGAME